MADGRQREEDLEQLTAYIDGELSDAERAKVERLIAGDPEAARLLDELRQTAQLLRSLPRAAASSEWSAQIAERMEREALLGDVDALGGEPARPLRWLRPVSLAAGFVLVVTAGWLYWPQRGARDDANTSVSRTKSSSDESAATRAPAESLGDSTLALGVSESRRGTGVAVKMEHRSGQSFLNKDRSDAAPLALAPSTRLRPPAARPEAQVETAQVAGSLTDGDEIATSVDVNAGPGTDVKQRRVEATATSAPTSAPTTTSAPAASQPTTRSAP